MITTGTRTVYEPRDYPVAPWARAMAQAFERRREEWNGKQHNSHPEEDEPCPQK